MEGVKEVISRNLTEIRERISRAAVRSGRNAGDVRLVAVTKTVGLDEIDALIDLGVTELGENRVEDAAPKIAAVSRENVRWHMIGNVQRRKARDAAQYFDCVDSVDRIEVAAALDRRCQELGRTMPVLIEVNVSGENSKHGFVPAEVEIAMGEMRRMSRLDVQGLMTMAPLVEDPETVRPVFRRLRELAEKLQLHELSMGMSQDYEVAIEEGATQVRIGTALFV